MLDIRLIREQTAFVKAELGKAGVEAVEIDRILECDAERRGLQRELDELRARRTRESKELGRMAPEQREPRRLEMRALGDQISAGEQKPAGGDPRFRDLMLGIRNIPRPYVPVGRGEADNQVVKTEGEPRKFDFQPAPHWALGSSLCII